METALWKRLSAARNAFTKRRKAYFAGLEEEREEAKARKEKLVTEAEALAASTDWGPTAAAYRDLMRSWKAAGRADRAAEEELWGRFKAAQDTFFARPRQGAARPRTPSCASTPTVKAALLAEAEKLLPVTDARRPGPRCAASRSAGSRSAAVPRDAHERLEGGLRRVEDAVRKAEDAQWRRSNPEALSRAKGTVEQIRAAISQLEEQLARAKEQGDDKAAQQAEEALAARRSWLEEAERTLAELSG